MEQKPRMQAISRHDLTCMTQAVMSFSWCESLAPNAAAAEWSSLLPVGSGVSKRVSRRLERSMSRRCIPSQFPPWVPKQGGMVSDGAGINNSLTLKSCIVGWGLIKAEQGCSPSASACIVPTLPQTRLSAPKPGQVKSGLEQTRV